MPCVARGRDVVEPATNQRSSATTARRKTRFVVRRGRINVGDVVVVEEEEREKRSWLGAKLE